MLVLNLFVIAWGAYVRATGSGAGCGSHWPLCNGVVVPREPRIETLIELTHRTTSGLALVAVFLLTIWVIRARPANDPARKPAIASAVFMIVEALLGAALVKFGWVTNDASWGRVAGLGLHLTTTFVLLAALSLTAWRLAGFPGNRWREEGADAALVFSMLLLTLAVGVSGAITSLGDTLFPSATVAEGMRRDFLPTAHFLERLRVVHPALAILAAIAVVRGAWLLTRRRPSLLTSRMAMVTTGAVVLQIILGATNLALNAPTALQLTHLLVADAVWISVVLLGAAALGEPHASTATTGAL